MEEKDELPVSEEKPKSDKPKDSFFGDDDDDLKEDKPKKEDVKEELKADKIDYEARQKFLMNSRRKLGALQILLLIFIIGFLQSYFLCSILFETDYKDTFQFSIQN